MRPFARTKKWLRGYWLTHLVICFCLLILFAPQIEAAASAKTASEVVISNEYQQAAVVYPLRPNYSIKRSNNEEHLFTCETAALPVWFCGKISPDLQPFLNHDNYFASTARKGLRQACQLLDLPPPCFS